MTLKSTEPINGKSHSIRVLVDSSTINQVILNNHQVQDSSLMVLMK